MDGDREIRIALVGAGGVNFGCPEGPWNHSSRLERENVRFTAIVDPDTALAERRLREKLAGDWQSCWAGCQIFSSHKELLASPWKPDAVVLGSPASCRGSIHDPELAVELDFVRAGVHLLVEKPLSIRSPAEVIVLAHTLECEAAHNNLCVAVGYMLRCNAAVVAAQRILTEFDIRPAAIFARFSCAYEAFTRPAWWDASKSGPCIVEQATHFVDAMRFLLGAEVVEASVKAVGVSPNYPLRSMPAHPAGEHTVPREHRNRRATAAVWSFEGGAIACLAHTMLLHGDRSFAEIDVVGDGCHLIIRDPYHSPGLLLRRPGSSSYEEVKLQDVDMYQEQDRAWLAAIRASDPSIVKCGYYDAAKTYEASWWISDATEAPGEWREGGPEASTNGVAHSRETNGSIDRGITSGRL